MNVTALAVRRRTFLFVLVVMALAWGVSSFRNMSRREDPEILVRTAKVITRWPGAPASKIELLVTDVIEDAVAGIDEVDEITSTSQAGVSFITVELDETVLELDQIWDELRAEVAAIEGDLPQGCGKPFVNANFGDVSAVCLVVCQTPAPGRDSIERPYTDRQLELIAEQIEDAVEDIDDVAGAELHGIQEELIELEIDAAQWARLGLTHASLARAIDERNIVASGGLIETESGRYVIRPTGEFDSLADLEDVVVDRSSSGAAVRLGDLAVDIRRGYKNPARDRIRYVAPDLRFDRCVLIGIEMKSGRNVVALGAEVASRIAELEATTLPPDIAVRVVNDLPRQVETLVKSFVTNLWQAILIVLLVALLMMGWRPALIMATAVPLCMISAIAVVRLFGVELEQFSIASLIIALGMIVDNAIVVSDNVVELLKKGRSKLEAAVEGASGLAVPVLTSTLTTVAAFLPLLTIEGGTGEYVRSLPIVVSTTLLVSYVVAMTVTPVLCYWVLKPVAKSGPEARPGPLVRLYDRAVRACMRLWPVTLGGAAAAVLLSLLLVKLIGTQFFPAGYRDQFFVYVDLPNGAPLTETERICGLVEDALLEERVTVEDDEEITRLVSAVTFVGTGGPRMMLTMSPRDTAAQRGFLVVNTSSPELTNGYIEDVRERVAVIPGARIDVRRFMLGPSSGDPVSFQVSGPDDRVLRDASLRLRRALAEVPGVHEPKDDWGNSSYEVEVRVDAATANLAGVTNKAVADSLSAMLSGGHLTTFREGDHPIDVVLRLSRSQRTVIGDLGEVFVEGPEGKLPLGSVAESIAGWQPALIGRVDRVRAINVSSQVEDGYLSPAVTAAALPALQAIVDELPPGYRIEAEGETKDSREGQEKMAGAFSISLVLILLVLVTQYNSVVKPIVVVTAVPLALIGALLGLALSGWALGFMPLLGIVSLAGVVINNSIILIDFIETTVAGGTALREAVAEAGARRMKPILLTTFTTIGGLLPLALVGGPMWEGMAWAMISGLGLSTMLTLLVVPTLYVVLAERFGMRVVPND